MGEKRLVTSNQSTNMPSWLNNAKKSAFLSEAFNSNILEPIVIDMKTKSSIENLKEIIGSYKITQFVDVFDEQLAELFISENAQLYKAPLNVKRSSVSKYLKTYKNDYPSWKLGTWVFYPWSGTLIHLLSEEEFTKLRTIRNQFIVTAQEQEAYASFRAGCAGMSVGSNGAAGIVITGGSKKIKLADGAVFSGSNLNRVRTGVKNVGLPKTTIIARELYEMNPYLRIDLTRSNLTDKNINKFFDKPWELDVVIDEIDDVIAKIKLRIEARKRRIPVVMVTEPGDTIMLDVERYDIHENLPLFHGLMKNPELIAKSGKFENERDRIKNIVKIIGVKNLPIRDQEAALKVGSVIPSAPQLGSTAMVAGGIIAYAVRQLATSSPLKSGRKPVDLNKHFWQPRAYVKYKVAHNRKTRELNRIIKNM